METRANYVLIGLFTLATIFGAAGFIYWFQRYDAGAVRTTYRVEFDGSVSGLRTASAVLFNGMRVGEVTALGFNKDNPLQVIATIAVDSTTPIRRDTEIGLEFQGLTGIASLSMRGGTLSNPPLQSSKENPVVLKADPSLSRDVTATARDVLNKLDKVVSDNEAALRNTIRNFETVTETLARNSGRFDSILAGLDNLAGGADGNGEIQKAAREIGGAGKSFKELADNLDKRTSVMATEINGTADSIRKLAENLDKRTAELTAGINRVANTGVREFESLAADGRRTLAELDRTIRNFDKNPSRLLFGGSGGVPEYNGRR